MTSQEPERRHRLTLSEILELVLSRGDRDRSVVTVARNAAGDVQLEVKVRVGDSDEAQTVDAAAAKAAALYDELAARYQPAGAHDNATVSLTRNAKGETQVDVDVRTAGAGGVESIEQAETKASEVYERLTGRYPLGDGTPRGGKGASS